MGPGDADDWEEGEVVKGDSSLGELWPECLTLRDKEEKTEGGEEVINDGSHKTRRLM